MLPDMTKRPVAVPLLTSVVCSAMVTLPAVKYVPQAAPSIARMILSATGEVAKGIANMHTIDVANAAVVRLLLGMMAAIVPVGNRAAEEDSMRTEKMEPMAAVPMASEAA